MADSAYHGPALGGFSEPTGQPIDAEATAAHEPFSCITAEFRAALERSRAQLARLKAYRLARQAECDRFTIVFGTDGPLDVDEWSCVVCGDLEITHSKFGRRALPFDEVDRLRLALNEAWESRET